MRTSILVWALLAPIIHAQNIQPRQIKLTTNHIIVGASSQGADVAMSGDVSISSSGATVVLKINGASVPASAALLASNSSSQAIAAPLTSAHIFVGNGSNLPVDVALTGNVSITNAGVSTVSAVNKVAFTQPSTAGTIAFAADNSTATLPNGTVPKTVASGTLALSTSALGSAACTSAQTASATGTLTTDVVEASFNGDPTGVTGYTPVTTGMLTIIPYPTADTFNVKVCNLTGSSITPGAITLNWRVTR